MHKKRMMLLGISCLWLPGLALPVFAQPPAVKDSCTTCHAALDEEKLSKPVKIYERDIHREAGVTCVSCHFGDPSSEDAEIAMDKKKGFVGRPEPREIGQRCGKCHSDAEYMRRFDPKLRVDQWTEYVTSVHGQRNQAGDPQAATCISCHGIHDIKKVSNPTAPVYPLNVAATCGRCHANAQFMERYKIPVSQVAEYQSSIHAYHLMEKKDLSAPTCNDCHGNHGAVPPGVGSISFVCGQCHARQQKLFLESPHKKAFEEGGLGTCTSCHDNHAVAQTSDEMLGTSERGVCKNCHQPGNKGYAVGEQMLQSISALDLRLKAAGDLLAKAERAGMEISKPKYELIQGREKLIQARAQVHAVSTPQVSSEAAEGLKIAEGSFQKGVEALEELEFRRKGLAVSVGFILLTALALYFKIRKMERPA